jgi:hypothetical protein
MSSIFEAGDPPLTETELAAVRQNAMLRVRLWTKRTVYSAIGLLVSCASVVPFSAGHSLHAHSEPIGRLLVYLSMGLFVAFVYCVALLWGAWSVLRDVR